MCLQMFFFVCVCVFRCFLARACVCIQMFPHTLALLVCVCVCVGGLVIDTFASEQGFQSLIFFVLAIFTGGWFIGRALEMGPNGEVEAPALTVPRVYLRRLRRLRGEDTSMSGESDEFDRILDDEHEELPHLFGKPRNRHYRDVV